MSHHHSHQSGSSKSIFIAFIANLGFSVLEFIFGILFNSSAILADSIHDFGDALAIGLSYYFEKLSQRGKDSQYTLGYLRFSLLGAMMTSVILIVGSALVIFENVSKLFHPEPVNSRGMLVLGVIAIVVNLLASRMLDGEHSEQESVLSLHFLEDILGWVAVVLVSILLQFTDWNFLDPLLSVTIAVFILSKALPKFIKNLTIFLEKRPASLDLEKLEAQLLSIEGMEKINQLSVWSIDGHHHIAMVHIQVSDGVPSPLVRDQVHHLFKENAIIESAVECDKSDFEHQHHCL